MWYVYILLLNNDNYYKGCTSNLEERLNRQKGWVEATKNFLPVTLTTHVVFTNKQKAFEFEKYLKSGSGRAFTNKHLV